MSAENPDRYRGMAMSREEWTESDVGKASTISCQWCGERFDTPHDFYDHVDTVHPKKSAVGSKKKGPQNG